MYIHAGIVLPQQRIIGGVVVRKTDTRVTLGVSAGLFAGVLIAVALYKAWWKRYRTMQHQQSLRWRRSRSGMPCGVIDVPILVSVTTVRAKRTGAAASVECRRHEPDRAISLGARRRQSSRACAHSAFFESG